MDLTTALKDVRMAVDKELLKFFSEKRTEAEIIHPQAALLVDQVRDLTLRGGKRTRAFLVWVGNNCGTSKDIGYAMMAVELFQTFVLIHDDIIDEDTTRRDGPTVHEHFRLYARPPAGQAFTHSPGNPSLAKHFGTSMAILAGDLALVWADELMKKVKRGEDIYQRMKEEAILGQSLDIMEEYMKIGIPKERINVYKTAWYSVIRPLQIGAAIGALEERFVGALVPYGLAVGEGYQLRDDFLDGAIEKNIFQAHASKFLEQAARAIHKLKISKSATILLTDFARFALKRPA